MNKTFKICMIFAVLFTLKLTAQGNLGQSGANFLQIGVEPRGAALGGAVTASSQGASSLYWNPAGAVFIDDWDVSLSYTDWFLDTKLAYGAVVKNFEGIGAFGLSITSFYMDDMEITSVYESEGTNEYYSAGDISIGLSFAKKLIEQFSFGVTVKYIHQHIWNNTASQVAFDIGSIYRTKFYNLRLGMGIFNGSGNLQFEGDEIDDKLAEEESQGDPNNPRMERLTPEYRLPQVFRFGIAIDPLSTDLHLLGVSVDVDVPSDNEQRFITGVEYGFKQTVFVRGAYKFNYDTGNASFGIGFHLGLLGIQGKFNYAYTIHDLLGDVQRFGMSAQF